MEEKKEKRETISIDAKKQCLCWKAEAEYGYEKSIGAQMLERNEIEGLLPFEYYYIDEWVLMQYYYGERQILQDYAKKNLFCYVDIKEIVTGILQLIKRGEEYLLPFSGYLLNPEWVFWEPAAKKVSVCYLPGREGKIQENYTTLVEWLLQVTNHNDKKAVKYLYDFYDLLRKEGFVLDVLLDAAKTETGPSEKSNEQMTTEKRTENKEETRNRQYYLSYYSKKRKHSFYKLFFEGKKILLCKKENKIGRQDENDIWIPFEEISERHAILYIGRMGVQIMDINSMGGTFLNGKKLIPNKRMDCKAEDILTFSNLSFRLLEKTD